MLIFHTEHSIKSFSEFPCTQCLLCCSTTYLFYYLKLRIKAAAHSTFDVFEESSERKHCGKIRPDAGLFCCDPFCRVIVTDLQGTLGKN